MKRTLKAQVTESLAWLEENQASLRHGGTPSKPLQADGRNSGTGILEKARPGERNEIRNRGRKEKENEEERQIDKEESLETLAKVLEILSDGHELDKHPLLLALTCFEQLISRIRDKGD